MKEMGREGGRVEHGQLGFSPLKECRDSRKGYKEMIAAVLHLGRGVALQQHGGQKRGVQTINKERRLEGVNGYVGNWNFVGAMPPATGPANSDEAFINRLPQHQKKKRNCNSV